MVLVTILVVLYLVQEWRQRLQVVLALSQQACTRGQNTRVEDPRESLEDQGPTTRLCFDLGSHLVVLGG